MRAMRHVLPLHRTWRLCLALLPIGGGGVAVMCGLELLGVVARGELLGAAGDGERWAAVVFGVLVQPFGLTALRHARLVIDDVALHHLGFGLVCTTRTLPFADVRRWGHAVTRRRGRRERHLLFALGDGTFRTVRLSMYAEPERALALLQDRLGPPAPTTAGLTGLRFDAR
jgi:hypothetical protein